MYQQIIPTPNSIITIQAVSTFHHVGIIRARELTYTMTNRSSTSVVYPRSRLGPQRSRGISSTTATVTTHRPLHLERENSQVIEEVGPPYSSTPRKGTHDPRACFRVPLLRSSTLSRYSTTVGSAAGSGTTRDGSAEPAGERSAALSGDRCGMWLLAAAGR